MVRKRNQLRRAMLRLTLMGLATLFGCLPTRQETDSSADVTAGSRDGAAGEDTNNLDDGDGADGGPASDALGGEDDASGGDGVGDSGASDDVAVPEGCKKDSDCMALVSDTCHEARCDFTSGLCKVTVVADGVKCGGKNKCLTAQTCQGGQCVGKAVDCDDDDVCTTDSCNKLSGCITTFNTLPCNDGDPCTYQDTCLQGNCASKAVQCIPAKDVCAKAICVKEKGGCTLIAKPLGKGETCSDGDPCTSKDACKSGVCVGSPLVCNQDGDPCTVTKCEVSQGKGSCQAKGTPLAACDDKNPCTVQDRCDPIQGNNSKYECVGSTMNCDDDSPCTFDNCVGGTCAHQAKNGPCSDDDPCTQGDICKQGKCITTATTNCDDGNLCTDDSCAAKSGGCVHKPNGGKCSDGDVCTSKDACSGAVCAGVKAVCDDGNPCTTDTCISGVGCVASAMKNGTTCGGGQCWGSKCIVPKCGNTICEFNEDATSCKGDCPAGGGLCAEKDATCQTSCKTDRCASETQACTAEKACPVLLSCLDTCTNDGCRLGCVKSASAPAVTAYYNLTYCLSTKCRKNSWNGKQCKTTVAGYVSCIGACQSGVCTGEEIACKGSGGTDGCATIATCVSACPLSDNTCPISCIKAGTSAAAQLYDTLTLCVQGKCL